MRFTVRIPGQPYSANRRLGNAWHGGRYKMPGAESYQNTVTTIVKAGMPRGFNPGAYLPKEGRGMIVIGYSLFLKGDVDCDNVEKTLLDGVKWGLGTEVVFAKKTNRPRVEPLFDDARFLPRAVAKYTGVPEPYVVLEIDDGR